MIKSFQLEDFSSDGQSLKSAKESKDTKSKMQKFEHDQSPSSEQNYSEEEQDISNNNIANKGDKSQKRKWQELTI